MMHIDTRAFAENATAVAFLDPLAGGPRPVGAGTMTAYRLHGYTGNTVIR